MEESRVISLDASTDILFITVTLQVLYKELALQTLKPQIELFYYEWFLSGILLFFLQIISEQLRYLTGFGKIPKCIAST